MNDMKYGPQTYQIEKLIIKIKSLTPEQIENLGAAWDAARDATRGAARDAVWGAARDAARDAVWGAARDAAWDAVWGAVWGAAWDAARDATLALVPRDLIGEKFTQVHYDLLTKPWRDVIGEFEEPLIEIEFKGFPKIPRLNREIVITEKIDGTNACIVVTEDMVTILAQSRNQFITPDQDNYGFAKWVRNYSSLLAETLGVGYHYGEWWGAGIQRRYGLTGDDKRFSLFNVARWGETDLSAVPGLEVVPVLYQGLFNQQEIEFALQTLSVYGSKAAPGFMNPEGIIIWHEAARQMFKVTLENDEKPKGSTE